VLQLLLGAAIIGCGFVGVYWPGSADSFLGILGLLIAVVGVLLVVLGARGVHKLGHVPDPADLQEDQIGAPHATSAPVEMKLAVTSEGDDRGNLTD
jgi:hypothetical protein